MIEVEEKSDKGNSQYEQEIPPEIQYYLANLDGWFTKNQGQIDNPDVKYVYAGSDLSIGFIESGYLITLTNEKNLTSVAKVTFTGANRVIPVGRGELSHKSNYFLGNDSSKWKNGVSNYWEVMFENLYDWIDLVFYMNEEGLKYDFIVKPGGVHEEIGWHYDGIEDIHSDEFGNLQIKTTTGTLHEEKPFSYQIINGEKVEIVSKYDLQSNSVGLIIGKYDDKSPLIIDPLIYSTYIGGIDWDWGDGIEVDSEGNVFLVGSSESFNFPTTSGSYDEDHNGGRDVVVCKVNAEGSDLIYSTFIGGSGFEGAGGIDIDSEGNTYITGGTSSSDFPTTTDSYDESHNENTDVYVCKLNPDGTDLVYSTYVGGSESDYGDDIELDTNLNACVVGASESPDFPTTLGSYDRISNGMLDLIVFKLNPDGNDLQFSTFVGGVNNDPEDGSVAIAIDFFDDIYVTSSTESPDFPTTEDAYDTTYNDENANDDCVLFKVKSDGSDLIYSTFIGGEDFDTGCGIAVDSTNSAYVVGSTFSTNFPTTDSCYDDTHNGHCDVFVCRMDPTGSNLIFSTFIGGAGRNEGHSITRDPNNNVIIAGHTGEDYPITSGSYDESHNGGSDIYISVFNENGTGLLYSTFIGGGSGEYTNYNENIIMDASNNLYLSGYTFSWDYPTTAGAYDETFNGDNSDLMVSKLQINIINVPPTISILSPQNNDVVEGSVVIEGNASDQNGNGSIERVEVSIDDDEWKRANGAKTWNYTWNTMYVENGDHNLRFRAYDGDDFSDIQEIILDLQNENYIPEILITSPANNSEVSEIETIYGETSDKNGNDTIEKVEIVGGHSTVGNGIHRQAPPRGPTTGIQKITLMEIIH